jgi:dipeptidyl aminopeptidase/acylaminoacyl peptidase
MIRFINATRTRHAARVPSRCSSSLAAVVVLLVLTLPEPLLAQADGYLLPPSPIPQILDTPPTPTVSVAPDGATLALLGRANLPAIAELAEPVAKLAGFRINPAVHGPANSRLQFLDDIVFQDLETGVQRPVRGLPADARLAFTQWSPDGTRLAFTSFATEGIELWVADAATGTAARVLPGVLNATWGTPYQWLPDGSGFLARRTVTGRGAPPERSPVPDGPVVQENIGRTAPVRTYQDLLQSPHDEALFEHYFTAQLIHVPLTGGGTEPIGEPGLWRTFSIAPDGLHILAERVKRPYSYVVPASLFGYEQVVLDMSGRVVHRVADTQVADDLPIAFDAVRAGPRSVQWRADAPATLVWAEAQDGGDPRRAATVRDRVFVLAAPFTGEPQVLADLDQRYATTYFGRDDFALVLSRWFDTRREKRWAVNPSEPGAAPRLLADRSFQDRYADPGFPIFTNTSTGHAVMMFSDDGSSIFLAGSGASPRGDYPFLARMRIDNGQMERIFEARDPHYETVLSVLSPDGTRILTRRESQTEPPNFYVRTLPGDAARAITDFGDPAPQLAGITRELITYSRADGVALSGTLFLPPGYDPQRDGRLPVLVWAYPTEFRDAAAAAQVQDSPNRFSRPGGSSHLFLLTQGYAILDNPAMPIIGEGDAEPNDTYIEQLVASADAAVEVLVDLGVADRDRIGIGGHSYGAFMAANLLAHSDLFRAGIARSGAYNRTLTPFGFQAEQRSYWEATDTYTRMSPFTYANRIDEPVLLIHGEMDDNSGTFPVQSERMYAALKGHGATVRYVVLPYEAHGYRARQSILHTLAEMVSWLDRYVKDAPPREPQRVTTPRQ